MSQATELVGRSPFLRLLPAELQSRVVTQLTEHRFHFGERIVAEGDEADAYYLIANGRARVIKTTPDGGEIPLHLLKTGDGFGEIGLLSGGKRTATVRAADDVTVYRLDRTAFETMLSDSPEVRDFVNLQLQHRRLQGFLRQYTEFSGASMPAMQALLEALMPVSVGKGATIFRQGDVADAIYIVEEGHVRVYADQDGRETNLAFLRAGDFFGELSFMEQSNRSATVQAVTPCRLQKLHAAAFDELIVKFPQLRQVVEKRLTRYHNEIEARMPLDFWSALQASGGAATTEPETTESVTATSIMDLMSGEDTQLMAEHTEALQGLTAARSRPFNRHDFAPQLDDGDSAAACLTMVARHYQRDTSPAYIREIITPGSGGPVTSHDLCRAAAEIGLVARPIKKSTQSLDDMHLPVILLVDSSHWVVLTAVEPNRVQVADPAASVEWVERDALHRRWSGYGVVLSNVDIIGQSSPRIGNARQWLAPLLKPLRNQLAITILLTLAMSVLLLGLAKLTQFVFDTIFYEHNGKVLTSMVLFSGFLLCCVIALMTARQRILTRIATSIDHSVLTTVLSKILSLPVPFFQLQHRRILLRHLENIRVLRLTLVQHSLDSILAVVQLFALLLGVIYFSPYLAFAVVVVMLPIYLIVIASAGKIIRPAYDHLDNSEAAVSHWQSELVNGVEAVKAAGAESRFQSLMRSRIETINSDRDNTMYNLLIFAGSIRSIWLLALIAVAGIGLRLVLEDTLTVGAFFAVQLLIALCYTPVVTLVEFWKDLQQSTVLQDRMRQVFSPLPLNEGADADLQSVHTLSGRLEMRGVTYRYPGELGQTALQGINLRIETGQHVVLLGASGSGKSTLLKLLAALASPTRGTITIDDVDMRRIDFNSLRQHVGLTPQEPYVFDGTVVENIALADSLPDMARVQQVARVCDFHRIATSLPNGYDTVLGEHGRHLSTGQRQCLAIARSLYQQPDVLLLDESTGYMDIDMELRVWGNLRGRYKGRTLVLATQQLHIAKNADLICVLDNGRIVESGTHQELLARNGVYYHKWRRLEPQG